MMNIARPCAALALSLPLILGGTGLALAETSGGTDPAATAEAPAQVITPTPVEFLHMHLVLIPEMAGVRYVDETGETLDSGTIQLAWGHVDIHAVAEEGYTLSGTTRWTHDFAPYEEHPFVDVTVAMEHAGAMTDIYNLGISTGWQTSAGREYRPLAPVNRDAMAAFLYRIEGSPAVDTSGPSPFSDIRPGMEHYEAVLWAYQAGITRGWTMPDGTVQFRPTQPIARDAIAAFMYRYLQPEAPSPAPLTEACFRDVPLDVQFAGEICWMKEQGLSTGWADGTYRPGTYVARDAMAAFLDRAVGWLLFSGPEDAPQ